MPRLGGQPSRSSQPWCRAGRPAARLGSGLLLPSAIPAAFVLPPTLEKNKTTFCIKFLNWVGWCGAESGEGPGIRLTTTENEVLKDRTLL